MRDADWLEPTDDDPDGDAPRRARPLLLALASVPWLVVIALLILPGRLVADGPRSPAPAGSAADTAPETASGVPDEATERAEPDHDSSASEALPDALLLDPTPAPDTPDTPDTHDLDEAILLEGRELRGGWRVEAGPEEAVALAVVAGRAWLTDVEPVLDLGHGSARRGSADGGGYAEHLIVEAVEQPAPDAVVVTLVAVVLDTAAASAPAVERLAVPVALTSRGARLAGAPWHLPPPVLDGVTLPREAATDPRELERARTALAAAGLTDLDLVALYRTDGWPVIAEVATAGTDVTSEIWLRPHLGGFVVAGTTLAGMRDSNGGHP